MTSAVLGQEIIPDNKLPNPSIVITEGDGLIIEGGTVAGTNLFHSLERFSVQQGQKALFTGRTTTENIITRITGAFPSHIDGLISVAGNANLFLLNPNGIFFGKNAALNITGSFFVSTANSWEFADGKIFSATTNQNDPLLTFSVPVGVQWGKSPAGKVENAGNLVVGKNLTLVGENISSTGSMRSVDGKLTLTAEDNLRFTNAINSAVEIEIDAKSVELINTDILTNTSTRTSKLGEDIAIRTGSLLVEDSFIEAVTENNASFGKIVIKATGDVIFDFSGLTTNTRFRAAGSRGNDILLVAKNLYLKNGSGLVVSTPGNSITGNIDIQVEDRIVLSNLSGIYSYVAPDIMANGGDINIKARSLTLENGSRISSEVDNNGSIFGYLPNSVGERNAGDITLNVSDEVQLNGIFNLFASPVFSEISTQVRNGAVGNGGNININTGLLSLFNQGKISAGSNGEGNAGAIAIRAESLKIVDGGQLITSSSSRGNAGDMRINASQSIIISGEDAGLFADTGANSSGMGGNIYVFSPLFKALNNGSISTDNQGSGNGGNLTFQTDNLTLKQASITAETISGRGGDINISSGFLVLSNNSQISAAAKYTGSGGNININSDFIVALTSENNDIIANANQGQGGNIRIFSQGIFGLGYHPDLTSGNDITASSDLGVDGVVDIQTLGINPSQGNVELPSEFLNLSQQVTQTCSVQSRTNSFVNSGRSGLPLSPSEVINNTPNWVDTRGKNRSEENFSESNTFVEAVDWTIGSDGKVRLLGSKKTVANKTQSCVDTNS
ncbi:filamentous hemagglutinin N-terminal domain-containing protein [Calothrix sp. PCC 6303]|uniref:two-partner secretion domain-containing protein n=1 Tax=Calothrix sp. PCC 6303 TaxID=1170562 RepID=UPI0002F2B6A9|nr:filamentous hemagglutinin N-terminal domain-containing protein [Calothrix sp. PCC 6303]